MENILYPKPGSDFLSSALPSLHREELEGGRNQMSSNTNDRKDRSEVSMYM